MSVPVCADVLLVEKIQQYSTMKKTIFFWGFETEKRGFLNMHTSFPYGEVIVV